MKRLNAVTVILLMGGVTLIYAGIKGYRPQDVLAWALGGKKPTGWGPAATASKPGPYGGQLGGVGGSGVAPGQHPGDMPWSYPSGGTSTSATPTNPTAGGILSV